MEQHRLFMLPLARLFNIIYLAACEELSSRQHLPFEPWSTLSLAMAACPLAKCVLLTVQMF